MKKKNSNRNPEGFNQWTLRTDEEIQKILVKQEAKCRKLLDDNRNALDLIARALLEHETISGNEVTRLIQAANGDSNTESIEDVATVD